MSKLESPVLVYRYGDPILSILFMLSRQPQREESYEDLIKKCILTFEIMLPSQSKSDIKEVKFNLLGKIETQQQILASVKGNESFKGALSAVLNDREGVEVTLALKGIQNNLHIVTHVITKHNYDYEISTSLEQLLGGILEGRDRDKFIRHQWMTQS